MVDEQGDKVEPAASSPRMQDLAPREVVGRDTIARFQAQFRAAALKSLEILRQEIDRVYCDYHDDFVSRRSDAGVATYQFFQVKTSGTRNYQWSRLDLFGIPKNKGGRRKKAGGENSEAGRESLDRVAKSFVGKLLDHTNRFGEACERVTFLTNVSLDDDVEKVVTALESGDLSNEVLQSLASQFNDVYSLKEALSASGVRERICKLSILPGLTYLNVHDHDFESKAANALYEFSEVDFTHTEGAEIAKGLVSLVHRKSHAKLVNSLSEGGLDDAAGIGINELLEVLSLSKGAYHVLLNGGDAKALKSVSIIQRKLMQAGASEGMIETASRWKLEWDNWQRTHRHTYDAEITFLQGDLQAILTRWVRGDVAFAGLKGEVEGLRRKLASDQIGKLLTNELLLGGIFSALVRSEAR